MATQGPLFASTCVDDAGVGTVAWTTPGNAAATDNAYATATVVAASVTHYLKWTGFGFTVPAGAVILGIQVECEVSQAGAGTLPVDARCRIVKAGVIGATDKANATNWTISDTFLMHGSAADLWGDTWTPADVNSATFGCALAGTNATGSNNLQVDSARITVTYTPAAASSHQRVHVTNMRIGF